MGRKGRRTVRDKRRDYVNFLKEGEKKDLEKKGGKWIKERKKQDPPERKRKREDEEGEGDAGDAGGRMAEDERPSKRRNLGTQAFNIGAAPKPKAQSATKKAIASYLLPKKVRSMPPKQKRPPGEVFLRPAQKKDIKRRERQARRAREKALAL